MQEGCNICPRECKVDRLSGKKGYCGESSKMMVARAALHFWEEPCISGEEGSGTIFFCGCPLHCIFCQNYGISKGNLKEKIKEEDKQNKRQENIGKEITEEQLAEAMLKLQEKKANNINLVTATHYIPQVSESLKLAKKKGLSVPVIYNTGGYEKVESLKMLEGLVDVYLPDMKYFSPKLSKEYSQAPDYFLVAKKAIEEMVRQTGSPVFNERGIIKKGVIVRHMILPGSTRDSMEIMEYLIKTYGNQIIISLMNQYTPMEQMKTHPLLKRRITQREYEKVIDFGIQMGWENGFVQEKGTVGESFIPQWNGEGL